MHLRTPGREDEETIASGTGAAAAGGYCAILAMPNTEPVVDSAAVLGALIEQAHARAEVQVGFLAAISKGQQGTELSEMGELADEGAVGFTDDGRRWWRRRSCGARSSTRRSPIGRSPSTARTRRSPAAATCARGSAGRARDRRVALDRRERDGRARPRPRLVRAPTLHLMHLSAKGRWMRSAAPAEGMRATAEVTPHHLVLTDEAVRPGSEREDEPAARRRR